VNLPHPGDGNAMGTYTEKYQYDAVGNFFSLVHRGSNPSNPGWTRTYTYDEASLIEPGNVSNRLTSTAISARQPWTELYACDAHGNMTSMPHLQIMQWNFKDELLMTQRQAVGANDQDGAQHQGERTYYVYDAGGQRIRKVAESSAGIKTKERFYLGGFELYREYDSQASITLVRETLHVMDDKKREALVETNTTGAASGVLTRYQFDNHLGTACLELDEAADVISYEEYYPYGITSYQAGRGIADVSQKRYRYTGKERDEETGFYYHGARYYACWFGRWTSCDPSGTISGLNLFTYANNSPAMSVDPDGMEPMKNDSIGGSVAFAIRFELAYHERQSEITVESVIGAVTGFVETARTIVRHGPTAICTRERIEEGTAKWLAGIKAPWQKVAQGVKTKDPELMGAGMAEAEAQVSDVAMQVVGAFEGMSAAGESGGALRGAPRTAPSRGAPGARNVERSATQTAYRGSKGATRKASAKVSGAEDATFAKIEGQETVPATKEEAEMFKRSVRERKEISVSVKAGKKVHHKGTRLSVRIEGGPDVSSTLHTHPTSKVALFSEGDVEAFEKGGYPPEASHSVIGDKWPTARRELVEQGKEPPAFAAVKTTIKQSKVPKRSPVSVKLR
jgi:RHS repeat-associated protein